MMEEMRELNLEEMEMVSGGSRRKVYTGNERNAILWNSPTAGHIQIGSVTNNTIVEVIGGPVEDFASGKSYVEVIVNGTYGWMAASILGFK